MALQDWMGHHAIQNAMPYWVVLCVGHYTAYIINRIQLANYCKRLGIRLSCYLHITTLHPHCQANCSLLLHLLGPVGVRLAAEVDSMMSGSTMSPQTVTLN